MIDSIPMMAIALIAGHFLADYPLQGDFLSKAKNPFAPIPGVPWLQAMVAHCFIHGAFVAFITGIWWLLIFEFVVHYWTDVMKCVGQLSFNQDQAIHLGMKLAFLMIWIYQ